jgi:hypothetical protein
MVCCNSTAKFAEGAEVMQDSTVLLMKGSFQVREAAFRGVCVTVVRCCSLVR